MSLFLVSGLAAGAYWIRSRQTSQTPIIALIPQTAGAMLWDVENLGATAAASELKVRLYRNAPTSESDVAGQVSLVDRVSRGNYRGLILAPNHPLAILVPVRHALAAGLSVVIVSAQLNLPAGGRLGYVVNDDEKMGELAAAEIGFRLKGKGTIALAGIARYAPGIKDRVRSAERLLAEKFPKIRVVSRLGAAFNTSLAEEFIGGALDSHPGLNAVLSFTAISTRGGHAALKSRRLQNKVTLVGCEQDTDLIGYVNNGEIAGVVAENTYRMGYEAVRLISSSLEGRPMPARLVIPPLLLTRSNIDSAEAHLLTGLPK